jgi:N-acetylated-alpha-linked acidic dipeptidase
MRQVVAIVMVFCCLGLADAEEVAARPDLIGFTTEASQAQRAREETFDGMLDADNLDRWMQRLTAHPHPVGSPWGKSNADWLVEQFRSWGYKAELATYHVLFPTPLERYLELLEPGSFVASLHEPAILGDATSQQQDEHLPAYNAYSIDGDVTGELVYVNYGVPDDYEQLAQRGVSVEGRIVIARYGGSWRGIKPKVAAENGAIGCILYSDPRDDGYFQGRVYPEGAFKNEHGAQRGSVADMPLFPGDPLTPGVGATRNAKRLAREEAPTLTKIPVLPISYSDAWPLLESIRGPVAPAEWRGALPITYHIGPGPAKVHLKVKFDWKIVPAYNVIARLEGSERPDQWVMRGNHHDAWVSGARDPISGMVALLEEARAIGELVKQGWKPKRTILYGAWDAEEPGLLGSTEWVEHNAAELSQRLVAYINTDGNSRGFLSAGGSHTLEKFFNQVARDVIDPQTGVSVAQRLRANMLVNGSEDAQDVARNRADLRLYALGSGSDYTPFLQHLGIASLNLSYGGEGNGGEYHSIYDSYNHYTKFVDPGFEYGVALARTAGRTTMRLADADVLPFDFTNFAETIGMYVDEIAELEDDLREEIQTHNRLLDEKAYELAADPRKTFIPSARREAVPHLNLAPLRNALERLVAVAEAHALVVRSPLEWPPSEQRSIDVLLYETERLLTRAEGLPRRSWFRHQIYSPGFYTGYGVKTLPGAREAIELESWDEAAREIERVSGVIEGIADKIEQITKRIERGDG